VRRLFSSVPVRREWLLGADKFAEQLESVCSRFRALLLPLPQVHVTLRKNDTLLLHVPPHNDVLARVQALCGVAMVAVALRGANADALFRIQNVFAETRARRRADDCARHVYVNARELNCDSSTLLDDIGKLLVTRRVSALTARTTPHCSLVVLLSVVERMTQDELRFGDNIDVSIMRALRSVVCEQTSTTASVQRKPAAVSISTPITSNVAQKEIFTEDVDADGDDDDDDNTITDNYMSVVALAQRWSNPCHRSSSLHVSVDDATGRARRDIILNVDDLRQLRFIAQVDRKFLLCWHSARRMLVVCDQHAVDERIVLEVCIVVAACLLACDTQKKTMIDGDSNWKIKFLHRKQRALQQHAT
jgi:DNA mismatch repair ATPase MutL